MRFKARRMARFNLDTVTRATGRPSDSNPKTNMRFRIWNSFAIRDHRLDPVGSCLQMVLSGS